MKTKLPGLPTAPRSRRESIDSRGESAASAARASEAQPQEPARQHPEGAREPRGAPLGSTAAARAHRLRSGSRLFLLRGLLGVGAARGLWRGTRGLLRGRGGGRGSSLEKGGALCPPLGVCVSALGRSFETGASSTSTRRAEISTPESLELPLPSSLSSALAPPPRCSALLRAAARCSALLSDLSTRCRMPASAARRKPRSRWTRRRGPAARATSWDFDSEGVVM